MKFAVIFAVALLGSAVSAGAQTLNLPADSKDLAAAAGREGTLNLVWPESFGGADAVQQYAAAMNKEFGTHIAVKYVPGIEMARFGNQLYTEMQAGQPASSDVYVGAAAQLVPLLQRGLFVPVPWRKLAPKDISDRDVEADGKALRIETALSGVTYNTGLVDKPPRLLTDYLQPQWKNKIATTPYAAGYDILAANDLWGPQKTLDFVRKLSGQIAGLVRCGEVQRLATGEFSALVMDCIGNATEVWREKGAPVGYAIPADAAQKRYYYITIPKNARHPNAAALFGSYLVSKGGQDIMWDTTKAGLGDVPGSPFAKVLADSQPKGVKFGDVTIDWWARHPEIETTKAQMINILRQGR